MLKFEEVLDSRNPCWKRRCAVMLSLRSAQDWVEGEFSSIRPNSDGETSKKQSFLVSLKTAKNREASEDQNPCRERPLEVFLPKKEAKA
jgi:hypothetical protein